MQPTRAEAIAGRISRNEMLLNQVFAVFFLKKNVIDF